jgi:hypothetical protein
MGQWTRVESALAVALTEAARAGRFDVVAQLARELEARRLARSNVAGPRHGEETAHEIGCGPPRLT